MLELLTEIAVLKEHCGRKRILLTDDQRRRLAVKGKVLGRKRMQEVGTLFTPEKMKDLDAFVPAVAQGTWKPR